MSQIKYIMSGGLAFAEEKDMEKSTAYSSKGWHVRNLSFMGYTLEKGEPEEYVFSLDYRQLKSDEKEEYFNFFAVAGWSHVASQGDTHLFRASPGAKPIYSDPDTTIEKYSNLNKPVKNVSVSLIFTTVLVWIGAFLSSGTVETIFVITALLLSVLAIIAVWTASATYSNKLKVKEKRGIAKALRIIPVLLFFISVLILVIIYAPDRVLGILASMVIGGVALPTAIWLIMSIYQKIKAKRI